MFQTRLSFFSPAPKRGFSGLPSRLSWVFFLGILGSPLGAASVQESWYRVEVAGAPAGWMVEREIDDGESLISESDLQISFRRGGAALQLGMSSRFTESLDHEPIEMWTRQQLGAAPQEITYRFEDDAISMTTATGTKSMPLPEVEWLTPFAAQERLLERSAALFEAGAPGGGVRSIEIPILDPSLGLQVVTTRWVLEERETTIQIRDRSTPASRWRQSQSFAPQIESVVYLAADGEMLSSATPMMGLEMRFVLSDKEKVQALGDGPELLVQSFIYPDQPVDKPRQLRRAAYRVSVDDVAIELPEIGAQRMDGEKIIVDLDQLPAATPLADAERYLAASTYFDFENPAIQGLYRKAVEGRPAELPAAERAQALRRRVARHLDEKNLDSILATAGEAASSRSGDCTEHAVLLSALLRADGIPARVATGVIYVNAFAGKRNLFAYHMWSQAFYDGRWHDLDATLGARSIDAPFDAAHIIFDIPDLDDEGAALMHMAGVAPLIGRAKIEVLSTGAEEEEAEEEKAGKEKEAAK